MFLFRASDYIDEEDISFIAQNYFPDQTINKYPVTKHEYYYQLNTIANLLGF